MPEYVPESTHRFFVCGIDPDDDSLCRLEEIQPGESWAERLAYWRTPGSADPFTDVHVARIRTTVSYSRMADTGQVSADHELTIPHGWNRTNATVRPSCSCGEVFPKGIKTSPQGWHYAHKIMLKEN